MLRGIHKASTNWLGRAVMGVVMGLLAISFGIWGIGDIFRGVSRTSVAKIGDYEISIDQFRQQFNDRVQQLGRQLQRPVTSEQARAVGLDQQLLGQLLAEAALDARARQLRLGVADAEIARRISEDPTFRGVTGQFDRIRFEQLIRQAGYTEARFVAEQRQTALRRQLAAAVIGDIKAPRTAVEALHRFQNEQRTIDYVVLGREQAGPVWPPAPEVLTKYFDEHKLLFRAPEFRKLVLLALTAEDLARTAEIAPEELKKAYERQKARYSTPEKRAVQQIVFPTADEAAKAAERLAGGASLAEIAKERGLTDKDMDLGMMAKSDFVDRAVGDAAFALKEGTTSAPVTGRFGTTIVRVTRIEPGVTKSLPDIEKELRRDIAIDQAKEDLSKLRDKVEDELASGLRVEEVARKLNLPARTIEAVDRSGRAPDGKPVADLPQGVDVVSAAFASDVGVENDALQLPGNAGYVWYDVAGITPARERTFDEVKDRVEARWRDDEVVARLKAKAAEILDKLKGGATLAAIADADKLTVRTATGLKRQGGVEGIAAKTVAEVFRTPRDAYAVAEGSDPTQQVVFRVTDITVPPFEPDSAEAKQTRESLRSAYSDNILGEYIGRLQNDLGVTINQAGLNQALGVTPAN